MSNNFIYKINSAIDTFSGFVAGEKFTFSSTSFPNEINLQKNDNLIVYKEPSTFYLFNIAEVTDGKITLIKMLEILKDLYVPFNSGQIIKQIEFEEYADLLSSILADYFIGNNYSESHTNNKKEEFKKHLNCYNKIYFGAPGTGKSHKIKEDTAGVPEEQKQRIVFHPDYDYASFVGGYKPVTEEDGSVKYKFQPQVFIEMYVKAYKNPERSFFLIIEEINRGNCAEIFGDIFQLLDRNPDYKVTPSEDLKVYLEKEENIGFGKKGFEDGKMTMPENLTILATMNTSDQSLYPMDSAFKRRWQWEYIPIRTPQNENDKSSPSFSFTIKVDDNFEIRWTDFMREVNSHILANPTLGMDKCLGNFFIIPTEGNTIKFDEFVNKVMFYLWNDVFKDEDNPIFGKEGYSALFPIETKGVAFFKNLIDNEKLKLENIAEKLNQNSKEYPAQSVEIEKIAESEGSWGNTSEE